MIAVLSWYIAITLIGWLAWPLAFRLVPGLPDRGYTFSRALGLMLTGYVFWLLGSLGFLKNTVGGMLFSALIVLGLALWAYLTREDRTESIRSWLTSHARMVVIAELLFVLAFVGWAIVRAYNPEISGTEKPMELTFLNGVRTSPVFPPRDPWLSGYAISYYYFGYVLIAILADLTGTASEIAFNLGIALLFALTLIGSYGVVYNLVTARRGVTEVGKTAVSALLAPIFVGVMGNLAGLLELLRAMGWKLLPVGFWKWLGNANNPIPDWLHYTPRPKSLWMLIDLEDLEHPVREPIWPAENWRFWWWWRGSRVIRDRDLIGNAISLQPIDEFPFFSFLLGDMHPHVLALPFVLLALGLALNVLLQSERLNKSQLALYTLSFGALAFLNTWDLPIYLFILVCAMIVREIRVRGEVILTDFITPILSGLGIFVAGIIAYLPWYISFSSQAGGILPNALFPTRLHQFFIMFGPFLFVIGWFLIDRARRHGKHMDFSTALGIGGVLLFTLTLIMVVMGLAAARIDAGVRNFLASSIDPTLIGQTDAVISPEIPRLFGEVMLYRLTHPLTALLLIGMIVLSLAALLPKVIQPSDDDPQPIKANLNPVNGFVLLLIITASLLTLGPEFVYLRDVFGQRLNTVFKFYYAAWILFGIAAAYAAHEVFSRPRFVTRAVFGTILTVLIVSGLIYPIFAISAKTNNFAESDTLPTLDGLSFIERSYTGDYLAIEWLRANADPNAVILEAVGGQYSYYGRVSMATGLPTILGWPGHERQWRGESYSELAGTREQDIKEIYDTVNMLRAQELIEKYGITYIFVGSLEQDTSFASAGGIAKFEQFLTAVYRDQNVTIYRADQPLIQDVP